MQGTRKISKLFFVKNLSVAFIANLISLIGSTLLTLVLPKFIGVEQYAYYQLYVFYASYVGFLGLGWIEGIYLRYGGDYYEKLDYNLFSAQFRMFYIFETIISITIFIFSFFSSQGIDKQFIIICFGICVIVYLPRALLHNLLQTTGRIKEYAIGVIIEKTAHIIIAIVGIALGNDSFVWFVISELLGRLFAALYIFYVCKDIVLEKPVPFKKINTEVKSNISCGLALMISNVASMLIIGVMRQSIEFWWDVATFGKISLTLSISNLLMTFINSVALVIFPMLKRSNKNELGNIYNNMRTVLMVPILFFLVFYYPVKVLLSIWLPQYAESLNYMALLFPMCVYESKMSLLVNTFMKAVRKEKVLLIINIFTVGCSLVTAGIVCKIMHSLDLAIFSIVVLLALRCIISEIILKKYIDINIYKDICLETFLTCLFIICSWIISGLMGVFVYFIAYVGYFIIKKKDVWTIKNKK